MRSCARLLASLKAGVIHRQRQDVHSTFFQQVWNISRVSLYLHSDLALGYRPCYLAVSFLDNHKIRLGDGSHTGTTFLALTHSHVNCLFTVAICLVDNVADDNNAARRDQLNLRGPNYSPTTTCPSTLVPRMISIPVDAGYHLLHRFRALTDRGASRNPLPTL